jgi:hypothetical protein
MVMIQKMQQSRAARALKMNESTAKMIFRNFLKLEIREQEEALLTAQRYF